MSVETHSLTATLEDSTPLKVLEGSITLDDTRTPYAQATIRVASPTSLSVTNPRLIKRVVLVATRTVTPATAPAEARTFNLHIRGRRIHDDGTTTLRLASDEALLADLRVTEPWSKTGLTSVRALVNWVFGTLAPAVFSAASFTLDPTGSNATIVMPSDGMLPISPGQKLTDVINPYLQEKNLRLWCDEARVWRLGPASPVTAGSITLLVGGRVTAAEDNIDRDGDYWADGVIVKYLRASKDWKEGSLSIFPWASSIANASRYFYYELDAAPPWPFDAVGPADRSAAATGIYSRMVNRGRQAPVDAVSVYTAAPGQAATISTPATSAQVGTVQAVEWRFPAGEMTVTTRNLTG